MATLVLRNTKGSALTFTEFDNNFSGLNADVATVSTAAAAAATTADSSLIHPYYFFHGYAGSQLAGDSVFFDLAAGNNGVRGADLSDSDMFTNAGYVSTKAPSSPYDICIRMPNLNYDYPGGEGLFIFWRGIITAPASETAMMGDGTATSAGNHGVQIRCTTAGKVYIVLFGTDGGKVGAASTNAVFDGTLHDFAFVMDGTNKNYAMWTDGVLDSAFAGGYLPFNQAFTLDTKNGNTFNLGAAAAAPGTGTLPQGGLVTKTRALVIIRTPALYSISLSKVTEACKALRANPAKLLLAGAI